MFSVTICGLGRSLVRFLAGGAALVALAAPSLAFLFWAQPNLKGEKVRGDEPGIAVALKGATPKEAAANLLWSMRAGLNVAALQCQFAPALMTVDNYNRLLRTHGAELNTAYKSISNYFQRTGGKRWQTALDQFTTQTYNGFSTLHGQLEFCDTAASIGRDAAFALPGKLMPLAETRMREFRNSLKPMGDSALAYRIARIDALPDDTCFDRKGRQIACAR